MSLGDSIGLEKLRTSEYAAKLQRRPHFRVFARKQFHMVVGQNQMYHFGVAAPPILVYFSGDWDVHRGYDLDFDPWPHHSRKDHSRYINALGLSPSGVCCFHLSFWHCSSARAGTKDDEVIEELMSSKVSWPKRWLKFFTFRRHWRHCSGTSHEDLQSVKVYVAG